MISKIRETRRRLKRRIRNRQSLARYCQRLGPVHGLATYSRLVMFDKKAVAVSMPGFRAPIMVRPDTMDPFIFEEIFILDEYKFTTDRQPQTIFDIGANVGYASLYFANKYPAARIITVEPERSNTECLKKNTASYPNITVIEAGIWHRHARLALVDKKAKSSDFQLKEAEPGQEGVEAVTIDDLMKLAETSHADIVKIDIEGGERELFSENTEWLSKVDAVIIELHDRFRPGCKAAFLQAIAPYGFEGYEIGLNYIAKRQTVLNS